MNGQSARGRLTRLENWISRASRKQGRLTPPRTRLRANPIVEHCGPQIVGRMEFPQYRNDIAGYAKWKGVSLTDQQLRVATTLLRDKRVLVPSGNGVGKSFLASIIASWHYDCYNPGVTLVTAPNLKQVKDILFKELRSLRAGDPHFFKRAARLESSSNHYIDGLTARSDTGYQGRHDYSVMVIFDEAEDIPPELWRAAETMQHYFVAIYNPTTTGSQAAIEERSGHWPIVPLNALEHPNVLAGLANLPPPVPNAVKFHEVKTRLGKWSRRVDVADRKDTDVEFDGVWYRPGPAAEARILGRRPTSAVDTIFSESNWKKLSTAKYDLKEHWPIQIGVDVARFGDDHTVLHARRGFCSVAHHSYNGYDSVGVARLVEQLAVRLDPKTHKNVSIYVDDTGLGGGVTDQLRAMGFDPTPINFGGKGNFPEEYPNIRSELLFNLAEMTDGGLIDVSRLDKDTLQDLYEQMLSPKYKLDGRGRRVAEEKSVIKARIGRSPDDLDAMCLAYYAAPSCRESYA